VRELYQAQAVDFRDPVIFSNSNKEIMKSTMTALSRSVMSLLVLLLWVSGSQTAHADAVSDLLIALESDGRSHTVQHTLATEDELLIADLPGSVIPQDVRFMGPKKETFKYAHDKRPGRIAIWSGNMAQQSKRPLRAHFC